MNHYHIIYNSSESSINGAVGFGVRCATEGTPPELLTAMSEDGLFAFSMVGPSLSPAALGENPELIRQIVPTYFFRHIPSAKAYVLGRKVAVGFDYTFYKNGQPGRLGNYVVDAYAFPTVPTAEEFEILLENAAAGSTHFIPATPVPSADNEEMRSISVGKSSALPASDAPFAAKERPAVTPAALDLLFAFIQGRKENKPVLVKSDVATPPQLMAQLAMLLPQEALAQATFVTNHDQEGKLPGVNIVFINEHYTREIFPKQWVMIDLAAGQRVETAESTLFRPILEDYLAKGDLEAVHKVVAWCMSDIYEKSKVFPAQTQTELFNYINDYNRFDIGRLASDRDLRKSLAEYFSKHPEEKNRLDASLKQQFSHLENAEQLYQWIEFILAIRPIDGTPVIETYRNDITEHVLENVTNFRNFYSRFQNNFAEVKPFLDLTKLPEHDEFLSSLTEFWDKLYPYFLGDKATNKEYVLARSINDDIVDPARRNVINQLFASQQAYVDCLTTLLKDHRCQSDGYVIKILSDELAGPGVKVPDFFDIFSEKIDDSAYTNLFIARLQAPIVNVATKKDEVLAFEACEACLPWSLAPAGKKVFTALYDALKRGVKTQSISRADAGAMCESLCKSDYPKELTAGFKLLHYLVDRSIPQDSDKVITDLWELAKELNDSKYLHILAPIRLDYADAHKKNLRELVSSIYKGQILTKEEILKLSQKPEYLLGVMQVDCPKPKQQLAFLVEEAKMTDEQALAFLEKHLPMSHAAILKSREPSIVSKLISAIKGLFAKKK